MPSDQPVTAAVIWADERLVVIAKPAGISLATRRAESDAAVLRLIAALPEAERACYALGDDPLWLVHRLDIGTSGLVLVARDAETHRELAQALSQRRIAKTYLALVWGRPRPATGEWNEPLGPDRLDRRRMCVDPAGRPARSAYRVIAKASYASVVALVPHTGRTHQLRVHAAHAGHPIVGDDLYGGPREHGVREGNLRWALSPGRGLLHAWRLVVPGFGPAGELAFEAPLPADFAAALAALGIALPGDTEI